MIGFVWFGLVVLICGTCCFVLFTFTCFRCLGYFIVCDSFVFVLFGCLFVSFRLVHWFEGLFWFAVIVLFELYFTLRYDCLISYWWWFIWFCLLFFVVCLCFEFCWFWVFGCLGGFICVLQRLFVVWLFSLLVYI